MDETNAQANSVQGRVFYSTKLMCMKNRGNLVRISTTLDPQLETSTVLFGSNRPFQRSYE